jgi:hypothetical protein
MSQHAKQFKKKEKKRRKNLTDLSDPSGSTKKKILKKIGIVLSKKKILPVCVPGHRARGIGFIIMKIFSMCARTIRIVFAAKLLKKLVSIHLVYLVLKLSSVPVPAQRGPILGDRFCVPNPNRKVPVPVFPFPPTTNYLCAARRETHRQDGVVVPTQRRPALSS